MGMFDTLVYNCPHCNQEIEEQSKAGDCSLNWYTLNSAPASIIEGESGYTKKCYHCNEPYWIKSKITIDAEVIPGEMPLEEE